MGGYLPQVFERFGADYPAVMEAFRDLAERLHEAGPLSGNCPRRSSCRSSSGLASNSSTGSDEKTLVTVPSLVEAEEGVLDNLLGLVAIAGHEPHPSEQRLALGG